MFHIVLFEPKIPQNTGNIIRLTANNGCTLHLIEPLGFDLKEKNLRRSGLDYIDLAKLHCHSNFRALQAQLPDSRIFAFTTKGKRFYHEVSYRRGDILLFGSETSGLPGHIHQQIAKENKLRIPMQQNNRSMNLSNTVAIVSYEAWRQLNFDNGL